MSLASSLNVGVSALRAYSEGIQVVSNNIANVNTVGYKASQAQYSDTFSNILRPMVPNENNTAVKIPPTQVGGGVQVEAVSPVFSQGTIQVTNSSSDLAIAGNGFFRVKNPQTGQYFVTRAGNFRVDADGYLVTQQGFRVQGSYGAQTKVVYDASTGSYDVKGQQDNALVKIPAGITTTQIVGGATTLGTYVMTVPTAVNAASLAVGMPISGNGIATGTTIQAIDMTSVPPKITMSKAGTATNSNMTLTAGLKTVDSGGLTLTFPADYSRSDLMKGMVITGAGIAPGTTIETFSGNIKKTIPASSGSLTLTGVTTTLASTTVTASGGTSGLAPGMILSAGSGILNGSKVVTVSTDGVTFTIDTPATLGVNGTLSVVAAGTKTLDVSSNIIALSDVTSLTVGMKVSGEGLPSPAYIGSISSTTNIDGTKNVTLLDAAPQTFSSASIVTVGTAQTVTVSDTSKLRVGDRLTGIPQSMTNLATIATNGGTGVTTVTLGATDAGIISHFNAGDAYSWTVGGVGYTGTIGSVNSTNGTFTVSGITVASSGASALSSAYSGTATANSATVSAAISGITDATHVTLASAVTDTASCTLVSQGAKVYPTGNSYSAVKLGFGDQTVVLSKRPTVDSFDPVSFSLGTYYTPAAKVGDVKVAFNEGDNYTFYGTDGNVLAGIPLSAAQASSPKIRAFNVGTTGAINIILSNGQTFTAGNVLLQTFKDPGALTREGDNLFSGITTAGPYNGDFVDSNIAGLTPSGGGLGAINGGSLELSNVDLGQEFSTMIVTQRAFQAGSRVITTTDQMLEEAVNLKR